MNGQLWTSTTQYLLTGDSVSVGLFKRFVDTERKNSLYLIYPLKNWLFERCSIDLQPCVTGTFLLLEQNLLNYTQSSVLSKTRTWPCDADYSMTCRSINVVSEMILGNDSAEQQVVNGCALIFSFTHHHHHHHQTIFPSNRNRNTAPEEKKILYNIGLIKPTYSALF